MGAWSGLLGPTVTPGGAWMARIALGAYMCWGHNNYSSSAGVSSTLTFVVAFVVAKRLSWLSPTEPKIKVVVRTVSC